MNIETKAVATLTEGYDNFPLEQLRGDLIMFSRAAEGDYEIYTIKPDGPVKRLTFPRGNDAHMPSHPTASTSLGESRLGSRTRASTPTRRSRKASCS
jgi:hypothetical protein